MSNNPTAFSGTIPENYERYLGPYIFEPYAEDLLTRIDTNNVTEVLELACGTGRVTSHLRKKLPANVRLVATDFNPDMITIAKKSIPDENIEWQTADAQDLPFEDDSFDLLVCQFGLMFVPDKSKALNEMYRVLKPGGRIALNTWDSLKNNPAFYTADQIAQKYFPTEPPLFFHIPFSMYDDKELQSLFINAGFKNIQISLVKKEGRSDSTKNTATGMLEGSPVYSAIQKRDPSLLTPIKKDLETALAGQFGDHPMISPLQAWVVTAKK